MKIKMNKLLRLALMLLLPTLIAVISFSLYDTVKNPGHRQETIPLYSYQHQADIDYEVFLKPNILYDTESLGVGHIYITEFIDYIHAHFTYHFKSDTATNINGSYDIIARVEGFTGADNSFMSLWQKDFVLLPPTTFENTGENFSIEKDVTFDVSEFNHFARSVIEQAKINSQVRLMILMNVSTQGKIGEHIIQEKLMPTMLIPLNANHFRIAGTLTDKNAKKFDETAIIPLSVDRKEVISYSCIIGFLVIGFMLILFFSQPKPPVCLFEKQVKQIFKNHGDRLVALTTHVAIEGRCRVYVKSIHDLIKIADEIDRPILYTHCENSNNITTFFLFDDNCMYILDLTASKQSSIHAMIGHDINGSL